MAGVVTGDWVEVVLSLYTISEGGHIPRTFNPSGRVSGADGQLRRLRVMGAWLLRHHDRRGRVAVSKENWTRYSVDLLVVVNLLVPEMSRKDLSIFQKSTTRWDILQRRVS